MRSAIPYRHGVCLGYLGNFALPGMPKVYLANSERVKHLYCLGITGKGKSKFLEGLILQDIWAGRGCGVIDPHSDLVQDIFRHLVRDGYFAKDECLNRVVYLDINRHDQLPAFNLLATPGDPYAIAQLVIEAFRRTWSDSLKEAPQFSNIMLAALIVLIKTNRSLPELQRLLTDQPWREQRLIQANDEQASAFFHQRYDKWGKEAPRMRESTLNKVSALTFNPILRRMLGTQNNQLDFRHLMDSGKVLLCDLGGEPETRRLLGSLIVTFLEHAAFSRRNIPSQQRRPFYLYMDEFQDFSANDGSAKSLSQILSETRKFGLHLTLAHQSLSQLQLRLGGAIGNVQTKVFFGMSRRDAEEFGRAVGQVDKHSVKDSPLTATQHPLYESLPEQWEDWVRGLQWQSDRRAKVIDAEGRIRPLTTLPLSNQAADPDQLARVEEQLSERFQPQRQKNTSAESVSLRSVLPSVGVARR